MAPPAKLFADMSLKKVRSTVAGTGLSGSLECRLNQIGIELDEVELLVDP
jgi:hypothetical protein